MIASGQGHPEVAKLLIEEGANVKARDKPKAATALIWASYYGYLDVVRVLIEAEADVTATDYDELTALIVGSLQGNKDVVKLLLDNDATGIYFKGGDGSSLENAIDIKRAPDSIVGVAAEALWIDWKHPSGVLIML